MTHRKHARILLSAAACWLSGCSLWVDDADREVYRLIEQRQLAALGATTDVTVEPVGQTDRESSPYDFVPHPVAPEIPEAFHSAPAEPADSPESPEEQEDKQVPQGAEVDKDLQQEHQPGAESADAQFGEDYQGEPLGRPFTLNEALTFATKQARAYQDAKEDLYLQALSLTLERHLWTPRFMSALSATYTEFPKDSDPDRAMQATADVAVEQRLPYGGQVTAQWIGTMVRDLERHVTNSESGTAIVQASIPLLRGGGRVAYESRYQAERNLIYAVRDYERFRRVFLTSVAGNYFDLLSTKSSIANAIANRQSAVENFQRAKALADAQRLLRLDADRARVDYLQAKNRVIDALERYESSLDEFKILIGMATTVEIDLVDEDVDLPEPRVNERAAIETAVAARLDLLNIQDRVADSRRHVEISKNNLLPDLNISGSVSYTTNPDRLDSVNFREDDETWTLGVDLELPLDRKAERNQFRSSLIDLRRAQRGYELSVDRVRLEVRRALRQIRQAVFSLEIQEQNIKSNEVRREVAQLEFERGKLSNRDLVEADNDLRQARDDYAQAMSALRRTILQFRLATGTLRVGEDGQWLN